MMGDGQAAEVYVSQDCVATDIRTIPLNYVAAHWIANCR